MTLTLDLSPDFLIFDNIELVSYVRRNLVGTTVDTYADVYALKRASMGSTVTVGASEVVIEVSRWHLQSESLAVSPRRGDRFTSTTYGTWEVLDSDSCAFATRWAVNCKKVP